MRRKFISLFVALGLCVGVMPAVALADTECTHSYEAVVTAPTCTEGGYTTYTCSVCGDSYTDNEIEATGHSWGGTEYLWYSDMQTYTATRTCQNDSSHVDVAYATVTSVVKKAATCTEYGEVTYTRSFSVDWATQQQRMGIISATGHSYEAVVTEPTCTTGGYTTYTCTVCGESYTADETEATGHSYVAVVTAPTCTEGGYTTYTCSVCGDSYTADETEATGHNLTHVEPQGATCTETGNSEYWYCSVCGGYFSDMSGGTTTLNDVTIAAIGHSLTYTASENIITESCANWWCGHSATATLAEPSSLAYDGSSKAASVSYGTDWKGDTPTVEYLDSSGATVDADSVVNAGTYTAQITVGGATASVSFAITATQLDAPTGLAWNGSTATWTVVSNASSYSVQLYKDGIAEGSAVTTTDTSYTFTITEAGSYSFTVTTIGDGNYSDSAESSQSGEIVYYTVTWSDGSEVIETQIVQSGDTPTAPADPTKEADSQYTYTFAGWDKEITAVAADVTYTATYTATAVSSGSSSSSSKSSGGSSHSLTETTSSKSDTEETTDTADTTDTTTDTAIPTDMASPTGASSGTTDTDYVIGGDRSTTTTVFTDVDSTNQYSEAIDYVVSNGLMAGTSATTFEPETSLTRGMIVTILHRLEGEPESDADHGFHDVHDSAWYAEAVAWAAEVGIASGYGDGSFGPEDAITREQLAAILYRYAEYKRYDVSTMASLGGYTDSHEVGDWAVAAMEWANANGLLDVKGFSSIEPKSEATRAETASTLMTFVENIAK